MSKMVAVMRTPHVPPSSLPPILSYLEDPLGLRHGAARDEAAERDVGPRLREHHRLRNADLGLARKVLHRNLKQDSNAQLENVLSVCISYHLVVIILEFLFDFLMMLFDL